MGDEALHPGIPGVGEAASLRQTCYFNPASLYLVPCLLSGFDPLQVTSCPTFPVALADFDSQLESSWSHCEEVEAVATVWEVAPAACKAWQVGSTAREACIGYPASSSFPG